MKDKKRQHTGEGGAPAKKNKGQWQAAAKGMGAEKAIPSGAVGILASCDGGKEKRAADELIHLCEEAFERLGKGHVGAKGAPAAAAAAAAEGGGAKTASVDALLAAEVAELKDKKADRFKRHDTGVRGTFFVQFPADEGCPSPEDVGVEIARHVRDTRSLASRHLLRLCPVSATCFVSADDVAALAAKLAAQHFPAGEGAAALTFAVEFEHRACDKLKRKDVIDVFAKAVPAPHKVSLNAPDKTILVQLVRNVAAAAVVPRYKELARLNLRRLVEEAEEADAAAAAGAAGGDAAGAEQQQQQAANEGGGAQGDAAAVAEEAAAQQQQEQAVAEAAAA